MAKRESKGQQVKTFKHFEPQPDLTSKEVVGKVYFEADSGMFVIYMPDHIASSVKALPSYERQSSEAHGNKIFPERKQVRSALIDRALDAYTTIRKEYEDMVRNLSSRKVIEVTFAKNLPWRKDRPHRFNGGLAAVGGGFGDSISFVGSPAIHLNFRVLHQAGSTLYRKKHVDGFGDRPGYDVMEYAGSVDSQNGYQKKGVTVIEWTQEKEDFLAGVVSKIEELGWLLTDFFGDAEANIAHSLTAGGNRILLAPPKETGDQHGNS